MVDFSKRFKTSCAAKTWISAQATPETTKDCNVPLSECVRIDLMLRTLSVTGVADGAVVSDADPRRAQTFVNVYPGDIGQLLMSVNVIPILMSIQ